MKKVFADTFYWVALINLNDQWRPSVIEASKFTSNVSNLTSDEVLCETLNFLLKAESTFAI